MSRIQGKIIAARIDNDLDALRLQATSYREAERLMILSAESIVGAASETAASFEGDEAFSTGTRNETIESWRREGVPDTVREYWTEAGLPEESLEQLRTTVGIWSVSDRPTGELLREAAQALVLVAREFQKETSDVLMGLEETPPG
jgi:hypothetical protein